MTRRKSLTLLGLLTITGFILFAQSSAAYFVSDDWDWLRSAHNNVRIIPDFFANYAGGHSGGSYNPLSSLWINTLYHFFKLNPAPYHFASTALHILNAWLIALLAGTLLKLFSVTEKKQAEHLAWLVGFLFLVWPTHVEAVNWIASVPHLLATFFYVLSLYAYCVWRDQKKMWFLLISIVSGTAAFFSKEIAISLPVVIVIVEIMYQRTVSKKFEPKKFGASVIFFIGAGFFLCMRFIATGLFFGTYADQSLIIRPTIWLHTFFTFFEEMLSLGMLRRPWSEFYFHFPKWGLLAAAILVGGIFALLWRKKKSFPLHMLLLFIISILPFVPLGFNRLSAEAERYTYLPSLFFILGLVVVISYIGTRWLRDALYVCICIISVALIFDKNMNWSVAGSASKEIITTFSRYIAPNPVSDQYIFVGLPDTIGGAHVFRNNIREAIEMNYPGFYGDIVQVPVYTQMDRAKYREALLTWNADERGFLAQNRQGDFVVTGIDRAQTNILTYELWNYDYTNFSSDTIRLLFTEKLRKDAIGGRAVFFTWNDGTLTALPYDPI